MTYRNNLTTAAELAWLSFPGDDERWLHEFFAILDFLLPE